MNLKDALDHRGDRELAAARYFGLGLALVLGTWLATGCAHSRREERSSSSQGMAAPEVPAFLNGPCSLLLTNADSFSCQLAMEHGSPGEKGNREGLSGTLLSHGAKLFFAPESHGSKGKRSGAAGLSFIWDVSENRGFVLSEALQGYAPVGSNVRFTNILVRSAGAGSSDTKLGEGQAGRQEEVSVASSAGAISDFRVWRAVDQKGLPSRLATLSSSPAFTINLSKLQSLVAAPGVFDPPQGFTKYETTEAMMFEWLTRQHNLHRSNPRVIDPDEVPGYGGERRGRVGQSR